jgi:hypothetical protein
MLTLVIGLRGPKVGEDTVTYLRIAESVKTLPYYNILKTFPTSSWNYISYGIYGGYSEKIETVFLLYTKLIVTVFRNTQFLLLVTAAISHYFMAKFIFDNVESRIEIYLAILVFICETLFFSEMNMMRQILAMSIGLQSIKYWRNNQYLRGILWICVGWLFHQSVLVLLIVLPLIIIKNKKMLFYIVLTLCVLIPFNLPILEKLVTTFFGGRYDAFFTINYWQVSLRGIVVVLLMITFAIIHMQNKRIQNSFDYVLIFIMMIYITLELMSISISMIARVSLYFRTFEVLFFAKSTKYFNRRNRILYITILLVILLAEYVSCAQSPSRLYSMYVF